MKKYITLKKNRGYAWFILVLKTDTQNEDQFDKIVFCCVSIEQYLTQNISASQLSLMDIKMIDNKEQNIISIHDSKIK